MNTFLLTDTNVISYAAEMGYADFPTLVIPAGEEQKSIRSAQRIWDFLIQHHATRLSTLINMGGGVITDLGGFAASTYMRGMSFVNVPTTLLAMVDAGTGGKNGIDYGGLKNIVGTFSLPQKTIIDTRFLRTLPYDQLLSGFAEMLKHALIADPKHLNELLSFDLEQAYEQHNWGTNFQRLLQTSLDIKQAIIKNDPTEQGLRKKLNFGHTIGHALEELNMEKRNVHPKIKPLLHGYAVAYGMLAELYLSHAIMGLDHSIITVMTHYVIEHYGKITCPCRDTERLIELMRHDKKNTNDNEINFTLLKQTGLAYINQTADDKLIREALEYVMTL